MRSSAIHTDPQSYGEVQSPLAVGLGHFRGFVVFLAIAILVAISGLLYARQVINDQLKQRLESELAALLSPLGLRVTVDEARWIEGRGLHVRGIQLYCIDASSRSDFLSIEDLIVNSSAATLDLIRGRPAIEGIQVSHVLARIERLENGKWNIEPVLQRWLTKTGSSPPAVPISVRDAEVVIVDPTRSGANAEIRDIDLDLQLHSDQFETPTITISGGLSSHAIEKLQFRLVAEPRSMQWQAELKAVNTRLTPAVWQWLPERYHQGMQPPTKLNGRIDAVCRARGRMDDLSNSTFRIDAQLTGGAISSSQLSYPITEARAQILVDNQQVSVEALHGKYGKGTFQLAYKQLGLALPADQWQVTGALRQIVIDHGFASLFSPAFRKLWTDLDANALADIDLEMQYRNGQKTQDIRATFLDGSFSYYKLPYRLNQCTGQLVWDGPQCRFTLQAIENGQAVHFTGQIDNPVGEATGWIDVVVDGSLPIDEKLMQAVEVNPALARTLRSLHPTGRFGFSGRVERFDPRITRPNTSYEIRLQQCTLRYDHFDYPFYDVQGKIQVQGDTARFEQISGTNNNGYVVGNGSWDPDNGLYLHFNGQSVSLDDELRLALTPQWRRIWSSFRPVGALDQLTVDVRFHPSWAQPAVQLATRIYKGDRNHGSGVRLNPTWFPYELTDVSGDIRIGGGTIQLHSMAARHGRTWMNCSGGGSYESDGWQLVLKDLFVGSLQVDDDLLNALPSSMQQTARHLRFSGQMNVRGQIGVRGGLESPAAGDQGRLYTSAGYPPVASPQFDWDLHLDLAQANLSTGVELREISGSVHLSGQHQGGQLVCDGQLAIDSLMYGDLQVTEVRGPLHIDNSHLGLGTAATRDRPPTPPQSVYGKLFDGNLSLDAQVEMTQAQRFSLVARLNRANLARVAEQYAPQRDRIAGTAYAGVSLQGDARGRHSLRGNGYVRLRDAHIFQTPVIGSLVKVLGIRDVETGVFDESNIDFSIQGEDIDLNRIELIGNAISLIGLGKLSSDRQIDLNFYTVVGRNNVYIPIITQLYEAGSQQFLWVKIDGTFDQPRTVREVLPGLNDSVKQLLRDFEPRNSGSR